VIDEDRAVHRLDVELLGGGRRWAVASPFAASAAAPAAPVTRNRRRVKTWWSWMAGSSCWPQVLTQVSLAQSSESIGYDARGQEAITVDSPLLRKRISLRSFLGLYAVLGSLGVLIWVVGFSSDRVPISRATVFLVGLVPFLVGLLYSWLVRLNTEYRLFQDSLEVESASSPAASRTSSSSVCATSGSLSRS